LRGLVAQGRLIASVVGDGTIDVPHEVGWHSVKPFVVIPRGHKKTDTDPKHESDPACDPRANQAGIPTAVEVQDRSDSVQDLP
jgi:hypothetical protein